MWSSRSRQFFSCPQTQANRTQQYIMCQSAVFPPFDSRAPIFKLDVSIHAPAPDRRGRGDPRSPGDSLATSSIIRTAPIFALYVGCPTAIVADAIDLRLAVRYAIHYFLLVQCWHTFFALHLLLIRCCSLVCASAITHTWIPRCILSYTALHTTSVLSLSQPWRKPVSVDPSMYTKHTYNGK